VEEQKERQGRGAEEGLRILIVEDNKDGADTLAEMLRLEGYDVRVCYDGGSAIAEVDRWRPAAAVIDIGLPGVTGYAVAQHIRDLPFGSGVILIAVTGYVTPKDIEQARYAGFNWHLAKPASASTLLDILRNPGQAAMRKDAVPLNSLR
jgi:two-component system CheB/CheR fusion protein